MVGARKHADLEAPEGHGRRATDPRGAFIQDVPGLVFAQGLAVVVDAASAVGEVRDPQVHGLLGQRARDGAGGDGGAVAAQARDVGLEHRAPDEVFDEVVVTQDVRVPAHAREGKQGAVGGLEHVYGVDGQRGARAQGAQVAQDVVAAQVRRERVARAQAQDPDGRGVGAVELSGSDARLDLVDEVHHGAVAAGGEDRVVRGREQALDDATRLAEVVSEEEVLGGDVALDGLVDGPVPALGARVQEDGVPTRGTRDAIGRGG